ncbi:MAG: hypothetical protein WDO56_16080 [Gammaproteobacteria bacterium]
MKNFFTRISLFTAMLGAAVAALGVIIIVRLATGTQTDELLATAPKTANPPEMKLDAPALEAQLEPVRDRALFYASRAFYVAPPPPSAPAVPPRPNYLLAGTFAIPHKHTVALLKPSAGTSVVKVKAGDDLEGWRIEIVEAARVVLSYHDERFEIVRVARDFAGHMTRAPLKRPAPGTAAASVAAATPAEATNPTANATVKSLGSGRSGASIRDAALRPGQSPIEARLYRPPP